MVMCLRCDCGPGLLPVLLCSAASANKGRRLHRAFGPLRLRCPMAVAHFHVFALACTSPSSTWGSRRRRTRGGVSGRHSSRPDRAFRLRFIGSLTSVDSLINCPTRHLGCCISSTPSPSHRGPFLPSYQNCSWPGAHATRRWHTAVAPCVPGYITRKRCSNIELRLFWHFPFSNQRGK